MMAAQAALIAETIAGMKRKIREENKAPTGPDSPSLKPTNRGNKLRENAASLREGNLGLTAGPSYRERIDYAGYSRYIISRNPPKYDEDGDEIFDDDPENQPEAVEDEESQTPGIDITQILCPLKHPADIRTHPALSHIYTSSALRNMIESTSETLRKERKYLANAKQLLRDFVGDAVFIPAGGVESERDWDLFGPPRSYYEGDKSKGPNTSDATLAAAKVNGQDMALSTGVATNGVSTAQDVEMGDAPDGNAEESAAIVTNGHTESNHDPTKAEDAPTVNGATENPSTEIQMKDADDNEDAKQEDNDDIENKEENDNDAGNTGSPAPAPRRMTTRAQTNHTTNPQTPSLTADTAYSRSPSPINPLYIPNTSSRHSRDFGLPTQEAEDTRRLLWSFVQKQEETVRGYESILEGLLKANRLKAEIWDACLAEGHGGEMSDGEDWYDREKWGLEEGLKKGVFDDEVVETTVTVDEPRGKRGRGRRN